MTTLPRATCLALVLVGALTTQARAQQAQPSRLAIDASAAVDESFNDADRRHMTGVIADALVSMDFGGGLQGLARPFVQRISGTEEWNAQLWVAALRYERQGPVSVRIDGGYIPAPIGSANLLLRPHLNPTIANPASLFSPLPSLVARGPRGTLLGAIYPLGAVATVSATRWDARAGMIDSSPLRSRRMFSDGSPPNPPQFANMVVGAGVTPLVGFRVGVSLARGGWLKAGESPAVPADRDATVVTLESELAFRYTKLLGEWTRDRIGTYAGDRVANGWFLQAQQTLAPRWFVAGRVERLMSPALTAVPGSFLDQTLSGAEAAVGYRLSPDLTLRAGHRVRKGFGASSDAQTFAVSVVWWRRLI